MSAIKPTETKAFALLARIADANKAGQRPTKLDVIGNVPSQTRARDYRVIDSLIRRGLVATAGTGNAYALQVTAAGEAEL